MLNLTKIQYCFLIGKKAKIYKKPLYEAIPHLHKPHYIDIHEGYTKRTKEQVRNELDNLQIEATVTRSIYASHDTQVDVKNRRVVITLDVNCLKLTHLQQERFKLLVGPRFNLQTRVLKMACEMYPKYEQNFEKVFEQLEEVIVEAKRAP